MGGSLDESGANSSSPLLESPSIAEILGAELSRQARCPAHLRPVIIYPGEDGMWVEDCPSLPGCVSQGESREAAIVSIREAIEGYVLSLRDDGIDEPEERFDVLRLAI